MDNSFAGGGSTVNGNLITVLDLFCGAGGFSEGFSQAGFSITGGIDNDKASLQTYAKNFASSTALNINLASNADETCQAIRGMFQQKPDIVIGGSPCQGISLSGPRKLHDPRNQLLLAFVQIVKNLQPKAFVMENVPGVVGLFNGEYREAILAEFSKTEYNVSVSLLVAADFGVPQLRKRIFFVGLRDKAVKFNFPYPTCHPRESIFSASNGNNYVSCEGALSDLPPLEFDLGSECQDYMTPPQNKYQALIRDSSRGVLNHFAARHSDKVKNIIHLVPPGGNYKDLPSNLRDTRKFHVAWTRMDGRAPAPTIDTGHRHHFHYRYDRVPTVREHARLQSFPDRFVFEGNKTQQFAQVGNAVPPLLARAIAISLKEQL